MPKPESVKWIAIGLLVGGFGLYAIDWVKSWKAEKASEKSEKQKNYV